MNTNVCLISDFEKLETLDVLFSMDVKRTIGIISKKDITDASKNVLTYLISKGFSNKDFSICVVDFDEIVNKTFKGYNPEENLVLLDKKFNQELGLFCGDVDFDVKNV